MLPGVQDVAISLCTFLDYAVVKVKWMKTINLISIKVAHILDPRHLIGSAY
jgi:hypothetical protein